VGNTLPKNFLDSPTPAEYNFSVVRHTYTGSPNCKLSIDPWHSVGKLKVPRVKYFEARIPGPLLSSVRYLHHFLLLEKTEIFFSGRRISFTVKRNFHGEMNFSG
jgi:hypothetical protein